MMKTIKWLVKQTLCKHDYNYTQDADGVTYHHCAKCGKWVNTQLSERTRKLSIAMLLVAVVFVMLAVAVIMMVNSDVPKSVYEVLATAVVAGGWIWAVAI
jgi:hypothetical protein